MWGTFMIRLLSNHYFSDKFVDEKEIWRKKNEKNSLKCWAFLLSSQAATITLQSPLVWHSMFGWCFLMLQKEYSYRLFVWVYVCVRVCVFIHSFLSFLVLTRTFSRSLHANRAHKIHIYSRIESAFYRIQRSEYASLNMWNAFYVKFHMLLCLIESHRMKSLHKPHKMSLSTDSSTKP